MKSLRPTKILAWIIVIAGYVVFAGLFISVGIFLGIEAWKDRHTLLPDILIFTSIMAVVIGLIALWCWAMDYIQNHHYDN